MMADKVVYPALGAKVREASNGRVWMYHVQFDAAIEKALNAPTTEFALFSLKDSTDKDQFLESAKTIVPQAHEKLAGEVFKGGWGPTVEDDRKFMFCLGWHSVEVCIPPFVSDDALTSTRFCSVSLLRLNASLSWLHISLRSRSSARSTSFMLT